MVAKDSERGLGGERSGEGRRIYGTLKGSLKTHQMHRAPERKQMFCGAQAYNPQCVASIFWAIHRHTHPPKAQDRTVHIVETLTYCNKDVVQMLFICRVIFAFVYAYCLADDAFTHRGSPSSNKCSTYPSSSGCGCPGCTRCHSPSCPRSCSLSSSTSLLLSSLPPLAPVPLSCTCALPLSLTLAVGASPADLTNIQICQPTCGTLYRCTYSEP